LAELKKEIDIPKIIVGSFNVQFSIMDRKTRQKIDSEIEDLRNYASGFSVQVQQILRYRYRYMYIVGIDSHDYG
jgi:hypothetical protein